MRINLSLKTAQGKHRSYLVKFVVLKRIYEKTKCLVAFSFIILGVLIVRSTSLPLVS